MFVRRKRSDFYGFIGIAGLPKKKGKPSTPAALNEAY